MKVYHVMISVTVPGPERMLAASSRILALKAIRCVNENMSLAEAVEFHRVGFYVPAENMSGFLGDVNIMTQYIAANVSDMQLTASIQLIDLFLPNMWKGLGH